MNKSLLLKNLNTHLVGSDRDIVVWTMRRNGIGYKEALDISTMAYYTYFTLCSKEVNKNVHAYISPYKTDKFWKVYIEMFFPNKETGGFYRKPHKRKLKVIDKSEIEDFESLRSELEKLTLPYTVERSSKDEGIRIQLEEAGISLE